MRLLALVLLGALPAIALAQSYPTKPIRMVVPFPPGGPADVVARLLTDKLKAGLGQPVIVDNRGGAGGTLGIEQVAKSPPDGYTVLLTAMGGLAVAPSVVPSLGYDPLKDLVPIGRAVTVPEVIVVSPKFKARTLPELVAFAKANPGRVNFGSPGSATMPHLAAELLKREAGIDMIHVPYRGSGPALTDLVAGQVDVMFADVTLVQPYIASGRLVPIAAASPKRLPSLPKVPTTAEAGLPNVVAYNRYGMLAPAGTPRDVVAKLHRALAEALKAPDLQERFAKDGALVGGESPEEFAAFMRAEAVKWGALAKAVGAKIE